jgi:hypothetical protein
MFSRAAVLHAARRYRPLQQHAPGPQQFRTSPGDASMRSKSAEHTRRGLARTQALQPSPVLSLTSELCARQVVLRAHGRQTSRGLVTVVENTASRPARSVRTRYRAAWAHYLGAGRKGPVLTPRQAALIANASFLLVASSFMSKDMWTLRAMNISSGLLMVVFNSLSMERPMWVSMRWGCVLIVINSAQLLMMHLESRQGILPEREASVHKAWFSSLLCEAQFWRLSSVADWMTLPQASRLTGQDEPNDYMYLLTGGEVTVSRDGKTLATLGPGCWIGEHGFLSHFTDLENSTAHGLLAPSFASTAVTSEVASVMRWRREDMEEVSCCCFSLFPAVAAIDPLT